MTFSDAGLSSRGEADVRLHLAVVQLVDDLFLDDAAERPEVDHVASSLVDPAGDEDLERVAVTVPMRVVVPAEEPATLLCRERRVVEAMRGAESQPARDD